MQSNHFRPCLLAPCAILLLVISSSALGADVLVKNDSLIDFGSAAIQAGFDPGESAAVWLESPCTGDIIQLHIYWKSFFGGTVPSLEDSITVYEAGSFPAPGPLMYNDIPPYPPAILEGPVMNDSVMNVFSQIDEAGTPLKIPIGQGEIFVVSFKFASDPNPLFGPSVVTDVDGCAGAELNAIWAGGWIDVCQAYPISGDFVIRAMIDCQEATGACCDQDALCTDGVEVGSCQGPFQTFFEGQACAQVTCPTPTGSCCNGTGGCLDGLEQLVCEQDYSGIYAGNGTTCASQICMLGACCLPNGSCSDVIELVCIDDGGTFQGPGTECATTNCPQPFGACCVGENCSIQLEVNCVGFDGDWLGPGTTCGPPNPCIAQPCRGDCDCDGQVDFGDINPFVDALLSHTYCDGTGDNADVNASGEVEFGDINPFVDLLTTNSLPISCP